MTQDMNNKIMTRDINNTRGLSPCEVEATSFLRRNFQFPAQKLFQTALLLLLMLVVGVSGVKAQTVTDGLYYIASGGNDGTFNSMVYDANTPTTNYYLCPTENWYYYQSDSPYYLKHTDSPNNDNGMPFMTTYQCLNDNTYDSNNALWCIKKKVNTDYYYIIHAVDGKYLTRNGKIGHSSNAGRMRIHLESSPTNDDALFTITYVEQFECYNIKTKNNDGNSGDNAIRQYLNVTAGNRSSLQATTGKNDGPKLNGDGAAINVGGIIGLWTYGAYFINDKGEDKSDQNSRWQPKRISPSDPAISKVSATNTITITDNNNLPNCTIRYTIGDGSQEAPTATTGAEYDPLNPPVITDETNVKAAIFAYGVRVSNVSNAWLNQTITLSDESLVYNGSKREPTVTVKYGENTIPAEEYNVEYSDNTAAGTATVTVTNKAGGDFYVITDSKEFVITKAPLTVTADTKSKAYGDADPELTYTSTGLVGTDALTGSMDREAGESVGTYAISQGTLSASNNYTMSFTGANLTINPKPLTITANNKTITYGDAPANDGVTYGEFAGEETESVLTGTLAYSYNYEQYGDAGSYTITPSGLSNSNYDITFVPGTLTVNPKSLTVTANNHSITYGDAPAGNGVSYGEFVGEETASVLSGTLDYDYSYAQYDDVGNTYTITPKGLSSTNYDISFVAGTLTVNQREVEIEWGNTSLGYTGSAQVPTATATNVVNKDEITVTVTGAQTDVGTGYTATATGITGAKAANYQFPSSNPTTTFSIDPGTFTPVVSIDGWTFGGTSNAPSVSDNMSGGDVTYTYSVKGENDYSTTVPTNAGEYTVKATIEAKGNYKSAEATKNFTISPKSLGDGKDAATGIDILMEQDGDDVKVSHVKDGETLLVVDEDYTVTITAEGVDNIVTVSGIGNYTGSAQGLFVKSVFTKPTGTTDAAAVYAASSDLAKPEGITPHIVRKVNPSIGTMVITPIDYIPKDVPVLMLRDNETTGFLASPKDIATEEITAQTKNSNLLKVAPKDGVKVEAAQIYTFYKGEFVLTKKGTLSEGKFYIYNPNYTATPAEEEEQQQGGGNAPSLSTLRFVIEEESTGVSDARSKMEDVRGDWYTLDGRKLSGKPTKAGLYIKNGRKTVIKRK